MKTYGSNENGGKCKNNYRKYSTQENSISVDFVSAFTYISKNK